MKKVIPIVIGGIVVILIGVVTLLSISTSAPQVTVVDQPSTYVTLNDIIRQKLETHEIYMSSPIKLSGQDDIQKYCSFFTDTEKQDLVQYCTSTEIKDKNNSFLGNIHMVGDADEPKIILALIQTNRTMSDLDSVKIIFDNVVQVVICDCWSQKKPGGLESVNQLVDGLRQFHLSDTKPHSKSNEIVLEGKPMHLELSENKDGYLWQFFIYN